MKLKWFRRYGILLLPNSLIGWIIFVAALVYAVYSFARIDSHSHSASDTLRPWFITLILIYAVYTIIGMLTSDPWGKENTNK